MVTKRKKSAEPADTGRTDDAAPTEGNEAFNTIDALQSLAAGETIMVTRLSPKYAEGFLDHLTVPEDGLIDILSEVRTNWGGGTFSLQAKKRAANGKMCFGSRTVTVRIAGDPTLHGRKYVNGSLEQAQLTAPAMTPVVVQNPSGKGLDGFQSQLFGLVQTALQKAGTGEAGSVDVVGLLGKVMEMTGSGQQQQKPDSFGDMERVLGLISQMNKTFGPRSHEPPPQEDSDSGLGSLFGGGGMSIEKLLMMKILGGDGGGLGSMLGMGPKQPAPPAPMTPEQIWAQSLHNQGAPPPSHHVPPPPHPTAPHPGHTGAAGPSGNGSPPVGSPPAANPDPAPAASPVAPGPSTQESSDFVPPITVDELCDELSEKSDEERLEFVQKFAERIGFDRSVVGALGPAMAKAAPPKEWAGSEVVNITDGFPNGKPDG